MNNILMKIKDNRERIYILKQEIAQNDYKIRKIYEYTMVGKPAPYDIYEIHRTDELKRQEINKLENEILQLKSQL